MSHHEEMDRLLDEAYRGVHAPAAFAQRVIAVSRRQAQLRRPSPLPEVLDFLAWTAMITLAVLLRHDAVAAVKAVGLALL